MMFAFVRTRSFRGPRLGAMLIAGSLALTLGGCAHTTAEAPGVQWQFNSADAGGATEAPAPEATDSASVAEPSTNCGQAQWGGCYVYRGGRDPVTGLAMTQL